MPAKRKSVLSLSYNILPVGLLHMDHSWGTGLSINTSWSVNLKTLKWPEGKVKVSASQGYWNMTDNPTGFYFYYLALTKPFSSSSRSSVRGRYWTSQPVLIFLDRITITSFFKHMRSCSNLPNSENRLGQRQHKETKYLVENYEPETSKFLNFTYSVVSIPVRRWSQMQVTERRNQEAALLR